MLRYNGRRHLFSESDFKMKTFLKCLLLACLLVGISVPVFAQQEVTCVALGGTFDSTTNVCTFANGLTIEIDYPTEFDTYPVSTMTVIDGFLIDRQEEIVAAADADPAPPGPYFLSIETEIFAFNSYVRSVLFTISDYTGGAHPNLYYRTLTFDTRDGHFIDLEDLFIAGSDPLATIFPIVQADLVAQLGAAADLTWINSGTGTNFDNYTSFVLTDEAIVFYFPPFQVAAGAAGAFNVEVPLSSIRDIFRPPYLKG
jgi:hypothetical protein